MIGFHTSEIQLWSAISRGQKPLNRQIRALSENFKDSSSESSTTWIVGAGASLTIWAGDCPPEADEPPVIFAKVGAIFYADLHQICVVHRRDRKTKSRKRSARLPTEEICVIHRRDLRDCVVHRRDRPAIRIFIRHKILTVKKII